jgi:hypothetical protein
VIYVSGYFDAYATVETTSKKYMLQHNKCEIMESKLRDALKLTVPRQEYPFNLQEPSPLITLSYV